MKNYAIIFLFLSLCLGASAQTKKTTKKNGRPETIVKTTAPVETAETDAPQKKNSRDEAEVTDGQTQTPQKKNQKPNSAPANKSKSEPFNYFYEFTNREFIVNRITIEHDENGKGKISFTKKNFDEPVSDPIQLSAATLEKINKLFQTLNFLEAAEDYQSAKYDYKHLGTSKIRRRDAGKERTVEFNWSENPDAKALADEYRKIGNQYVWQFDMTVAKENQPLEAPGLMDLLDSYLRRNEISDPSQMIPLLKELSNDERIPLMARNRATKLIKQIEKQK